MSHALRNPSFQAKIFPHEMTDPPEMVPDQCNLFELECLYDIFCESGHPLMEGLSKDAIRVLLMPDNENSRKIYARYQGFLKYIYG